MARVSRRKQIAAAQGVPVDVLPKAAALRIFRTALYVRLSIMDTRDRKDSESLQTQIDYLCGYIAKHPDLELYDCYRDNGETGTNFERPGFQRMMEDVNAGRINCIITKDLSRFGREHVMMDYYLEFVFPELSSTNNLSKISPQKDLGNINIEAIIAIKRKSNNHFALADILKGLFI